MAPRGRRVAAVALTAALACLPAWTVAQSTAQKCGAGNLCPESAPCCSQYGECGVGAYCLGGCDPMFSYQLQSCVPEPVCQSTNYDFKSLDGIVDQAKYLGDSSKDSWVSSGTPLKALTNDAVILTLAHSGASGAGTLLASTTYVWYGKVTAVMKSSRGAGVVSAFILLSDDKDEIDFEFIGSDLNNVQSNFYYQGITNYDNEVNLTVSDGGDTFSAYHTYVVDWSPTQLTWSVDGQVARTLKKADTFNKTDNQYHYPQTPARVQLSIWPAGSSSNGQGTVEWAGGLINWNSADPKNAGYFYSMVKSIDVQCYSPPSDAAFTTGNTSYVYSNRDGIENTIGVTGNSTVLKSLLGTGTDMDKGEPSSASTSGKAAATSAVVNTVPGLSGAGSANGARGGSGSDGSGTSSGNGAASSGIGGFSQGSGGTKSGSKSAAPATYSLSRGYYMAMGTFAAMVLGSMGAVML